MIETNRISEELEDVKTVAISGHIRPDGDCVGSCMALYLYIRTYFPDIIKHLQMFFQIHADLESKPGTCKNDQNASKHF